MLQEEQQLQQNSIEAEEKLKNEQEEVCCLFTFVQIGQKKIRPSCVCVYFLIIIFFIFFIFVFFIFPCIVFVYDKSVTQRL